LPLAAIGVFAADNDPSDAHEAPPWLAFIRKAAAADSRLAEDRIRAELATKTELDFGENPQSLKDVVDYIRSAHHIEIVLDQDALKTAGIDPAASLISKTLKGISLRSALKLLFSDYQLTYVIDNEVLIITTKDKANTLFKTKVYDIGDLVGTKNGSPDQEALDDISRLITITIEPDSWKREQDKDSGQGNLCSLNKNGACVLVAYQTFDVHEQIAGLLDELRSHRQVQKVKESAAPPK